MGDRPLDALEAALGESVVVQLKDGTMFHGALAGYDQHMNLVLESATTGPADEDALGPDDERVEDTIVIRGDNVVSIRP
ncbi:MAG: LSM domain-containing protein [Halobacteriales archaeon]|nr:LSM domain-containing protein [Halobacteriales archaeon]